MHIHTLSHTQYYALHQKISDKIIIVADCSKWAYSQSFFWATCCCPWYTLGPGSEATAPATGNVKMKRVCFRSKRVCFSSANVGVVFSLWRKSPLVLCSVYSWIIHGILKAFPFVIFHTLRLRRKRYSSVRRPGTAYWGSTVQLSWEDRTYRPTGLRRAYRKTALTVDWLVGWLVGWLAAVLLLVEIMLWTLYCSLHYLGVVNANAFELATKNAFERVSFWRCLWPVLYIQMY